jgi:hypothetical protein
MAADLLGQFNAAADQNFQRRVAAALAQAALTVYTESPQPTNHAARAAYAVTVITDPPVNMISDPNPVRQPDKRSFAVARLLAAEGLDDTASDSQILTAIANAWNALAGS